MAYPATAVLDAFTRSDEGPPPSSSWSGPIHVSSGTSNDLRVVSNTLQPGSTGIENQGYWNPTQFTADPALEVWVELGADGREYLELYYCIQLPGDDNDTDCYALERDYSSGTDALGIYKCTDDIFTPVGDPIPQDVVTGDVLGVRLLNSGEHQVFLNGTVIATRNDATYTSGYLGIGIDATNAAADITIAKFGGGVVSSNSILYAKKAGNENPASILLNGNTPATMKLKGTA